MFTQIDVSKEWQFLFYLIPVIIGIELAIYFFYQYYKMKETNLPLNRIFLAFGSFIIFIVLGPLLIQISRNFLEKGFLSELIDRTGWLLAFCSTIVFSIFIIKKEFSSIINIKIVITLMFLNLIPVLMVYLLHSLGSPIFIISIFFAVINGLYIIRFQLILIKRTVGTIRRKLKLFLLGAFVSFTSLIFAILVGLGILSPIIREIVYFIGVSILLVGFIIISLSVYNFPPFYEFQWRENLLKLFIINQKDFSSLYQYDFTQQFEKKKKNHQNLSYRKEELFSRGISGIESLTSIITGIGDVKINKIKKGDFYLFFEYGIIFPFITYVFVVKNDLISSYHLLKSIRNSFESFFKEILLNFDNLKGDQEILFKSFDNILNRILLE